MAEGLVKMTVEEMERSVRESGSGAVSMLKEVAMGPDERLALAATGLLGAVRDQAAACALQELAAGSPSSAVRKAARREIHRLVSFGISAAAPTAAPTIAGRRVEWPVYRTLASPIDGDGNRAIWFALQSGADVELISLLINDQVGIKDAVAEEMSTSRFDREARRFLEDATLPWVDMPADYCRYLIEEAHSLNATSGTALLVDYLAWRERIGRPEQIYERPLVYSVINAMEVRWDPRYLDSSGNLFDLPMFQSWLFERSEVGEFVREMITARQAGIVLAGMGNEARSRMVVDRAMVKLFDARRRALYKRRLEEMAYVLWKLDLGYHAREALAAAMALEPPDRSLQNHSFVRRMVEWSLEVAMESVRGERTKTVMPGIQLHLPY